MSAFAIETCIFDGRCATPTVSCRSRRRVKPRENPDEPGTRRTVSGLFAQLLPETVAAIASDHGSADLSTQEVAVVDFAEKVATDAISVTEHGIQCLRVHGLDDTEIFHVMLAAARCFFGPERRWSAA